jgi:hypothetical protein
MEAELKFMGRVAGYLHSEFRRNERIKHKSIMGFIDKLKNWKNSPTTRLWRCRGGEEVRRHSSYSFTTSTLDGGEWSVSRLGRAFPPGERTSGTHWIGGWVGLRAALDTEARGKIPSFYRGSYPSHLVIKSVVRHYTDWAIPAPIIRCRKLKVQF